MFYMLFNSAGTQLFIPFSHKCNKSESALWPSVGYITFYGIGFLFYCSHVITWKYITAKNRTSYEKQTYINISQKYKAVMTNNKIHGDLYTSLVFCKTFK